MIHLPSSSSPVILHCISGPDLGKRLAIREMEVTLGRSTDCNLLSDDQDVKECHVAFKMHDGRPTCQARPDCMLMLDGHLVREAILLPGQQIRIGRSFWQIGVNSQDSGFEGWIGNLSSRISLVAGVERIQGFDARDMFSEVFRSRKDDDVEDYFAVGTSSTTPLVTAVDTNWPKPWAFFKTFTLSVIVYLAFVFAVQEFHNPKLVPGLIMTGAFLIPMSLLIFFFEMNVLRNVSLYQVVKLVVLGGILSLLLSLFLFQWTDLSTWLGRLARGLSKKSANSRALSGHQQDEVSMDSERAALRSGGGNRVLSVRVSRVCVSARAGLWAGGNAACHHAAGSLEHPGTARDLDVDGRAALLAGAGRFRVHPGVCSAI